MEAWIEGWMGAWMEAWIEGWMEAWMEAWIEGWMEAWMQGWMVHSHTPGWNGGLDGQFVRVVLQILTLEQFRFP